MDLSLKQGAEQVSVSLANATSFQLEVRNQNIEALKEAGSSGIHVTLAKNQKRSTLSSNDFRLETLEPLIRSTLEALPLMGEDPFFTLPDPKLQGKAEIDLQFRDPKFEKMHLLVTNSERKDHAKVCKIASQICLSKFGHSYYS